MTATDVITVVLLVIGTAFLLVGSIGLLRFPDVYTRLHALTKADNLGLGFIILGLGLYSGSLIVAAKLILTWGLVLISGATASFLVANAARGGGVEPWRRP